MKLARVALNIEKHRLIPPRILCSQTQQPRRCPGPTYIVSIDLSAIEAAICLVNVAMSPITPATEHELELSAPHCGGVARL